MRLRGIVADLVITVAGKGILQVLVVLFGGLPLTDHVRHALVGGSKVGTAGGRLFTAAFLASPAALWLVAGILILHALTAACIPGGQLQRGELRGFPRSESANDTQDKEHRRYDNRESHIHHGVSPAMFNADCCPQ
jgi:hypothetical protein